VSTILAPNPLLAPPAISVSVLTSASASRFESIKKTNTKQAFVSLDRYDSSCKRPATAIRKGACGKPARFGEGTRPTIIRENYEKFIYRSESGDCHRNKLCRVDSGARYGPGRIAEAGRKTLYCRTGIADKCWRARARRIQGAAVQLCVPLTRSQTQRVRDTTSDEETANISPVSPKA
jgi:hypothetical protein